MFIVGWFLLVALATANNDTEDFSDTELADLRCFTDNNTVPCPYGSCVRKLTIDLETNEQVFTSGCQEPDPPAFMNKCDRLNNATEVHKLFRNNTRPAFLNYIPYVIQYRIDYKDKKQHIYKGCCWRALCNDRNMFDTPLKFLVHAESPEGMPKLAVRLFVIICLLAVLIPIAKILLRPPKLSSEEDYSPTMDEQLVEASGDLEALNLDVSVNGQLTVKETAQIICEMMLIDEVAVSKTTSSTVRVVVQTPQLVRACGFGHQMVRALRNRPHNLQSILFRLIEHGPYVYPFKARELLELFDEAKDVFHSDCSLVSISSAVVIFGDLRGAYSDLHRWLSVVGWPPRTRLLFLGNTIDRNEPGSLETIALICALKIAFPNEVTLLRGATESLPFTPVGRFPTRAANAIGSSLRRMCSFLPTAARVMERILAVPSGISPLVKSSADLKDLPRPAYLDVLKPVQRHFIFNRPSTKVRMYRPNKDTYCEFYGEKAVVKIKDTMGVNMVVRGGNPLPHGCLFSWDHTLLTLWSAPALNTRIGAIAIVTPDLELIPVLMQAQDERPDTLLPLSPRAAPAVGQLLTQ